MILDILGLVIGSVGMIVYAMDDRGVAIGASAMTLVFVTALGRIMGGC